MTDLPIACALSPADLQQRRDQLLPGLIARAESRDQIAGGIRLRFSGSSEVMDEIMRMIDAERQCCRFLRFHLTVEPDLGPLWLEVTGPAGTAEFLSDLLR